MKKILVINFFPAFFPPQSGGELRYYNMYHNLSNYYDVTMLSPTYRDHKSEVIVHSDTFREYRVPKTDVHDSLHMSIDTENICQEISALVCYLSASVHNEFHNAYQRLYRDADIIVHEFPYMLSYDMFFGMDNKFRIYNSHNFESNLVAQMWSGPNAEKYLKLIREAEGRLVRECDLVFATSEEERQAFIDAFGINGERIKIAPNGIDVGLYENLRNKLEISTRPKAFFIGSAHPPNIDAVMFITNNVAPSCPDIDFYIAGKCCTAISCDLPNVFLLGLIDEKQKNELFTSSDIAINPMFSGAGTNLKTLEFLSAGIPMISTGIGVRGLSLTEGKQYIRAEKEDFAVKLKEIIGDSELLLSLAENGQEYINSHYSWKSICYSVYKEIEKLQQNNINTVSQLPLLLVLNDFEITLPVAGGEVRIFNILKNLSESFRIAFLCLNNTYNVKIHKINNNFIHISLPKTKEHLLEEDKVNSRHWVSANDIVAGYMITKNQIYMDVVKNFYPFVDVVILEHPYMVYTVKGMDGKPVVYESLNFEYKLKQKMLHDHPLRETLVKEVKYMESLALAKANLVISVSDEEVPELKEFASRSNIEIKTIHNGVNIIEGKFDYSILKSFLGNRPIITFVGSGHAPNVEAVAFIINKIATQIPQAIFAIIGSVCGAFQQSIIPENVLLFGKISEEHKNFILFASDIALNPIEEGAGSNLKLAEYFAFGIPTVTTPFGMRGYDIDNEIHTIVCDRDDFVNHIRGLLAGGYEQETITRNAFDYAKNNLSWDVLANEYSLLLKDLIIKKRLLVVTYRYNDPPRGGGETFLSQIVDRIAKRGRYLIDVVTTDIGDIQHKYHYSCDYTIDEDEDVVDALGIRCFKFPIDVLDDDEKWTYCHEIFKCCMEESVKIGREFIRYYDEPLLMGGWYFPEVYDTEIRIWTSNQADLFIKDISRLVIHGQARKKCRIEIQLDGNIVKTETVKNDFVVRLEGLDGNVLTIKCDTFVVKNQDARHLGLYISDIVYIRKGVQHKLSFFNDYKRFLRQEKLNEYIDSLIATAQQRDKYIDQLFYSCRGPVSDEMKAWLDRNIGNYDIVLGHSIPFNTVVDAQFIGKQHGVPTVLLPHFHMEDEFYHWQSYYEALAKADRVFISPTASKKLFFDKINTISKIIPGGGIDANEFASIDITEFKRQYQSEEPFLLVLGRKAGGKNYNWVIETVERLNESGHNIKLVMIGRDDDKVTVTAPHTTYLGEQSRQSVLGALKCCQFVVNMSESESFGIVILESWLAEKPVIVNMNCTAFTELVEDGVNGLFATKDSIYEKIIELLSNGRIEEMGQCGKKKALEGYSWESISQQIEALFDMVLDV